MLKQLYIKDFAIIERVEVNFNEKMTTITGETGAGKSIVIDAINQLLGKRSSETMIRKGQNCAIIEAVFDISNLDAIKTKLLELNYDVEDHIILTKTINKSNKNTLKLNNRIINNSILKEITPTLIDIHSQYDNQDLLDQKLHLDYLDSIGDEQFHQLLTDYRLKYHVYKSLIKEYEQFKNEAESESTIGYYQSQLDEINQVNTYENELEELIDLEKKLVNKQKYHDVLNKTISGLDLQVLDQIYDFNMALTKLDDQFLQTKASELESLYYQIEVIKEDLKQFRNDLDQEDYDIEEIASRIYDVKKLLKRYNNSYQELELNRQKFAAMISRFENQEQEIINYERNIMSQKDVLIAIAAQISDIRKANSNIIIENILKEFKKLYLKDARFEIEIKTQNELNGNGFNEVFFKFSANKGHSTQIIGDVVSGGELSRIMLCFKKIFSNRVKIGTIIFDEIDAGVSGKVAGGIGKVMKELSNDTQLICITHLPQVASYADNHLLVSKSNKQDFTTSCLHYLDKEDRINEIATMLSGENISTNALDLAKDLLASSK